MRPALSVCVAFALALSWLLSAPVAAQQTVTMATLSGTVRDASGVPLAGAEDLWRIRVRQYRVIYQILDDELIVVVVKIGDRKDVYR